MWQFITDNYMAVGAVVAFFGIDVLIIGAVYLLARYKMRKHENKSSSKK